MEVEAPADAWYTWVGVALVSIAVGGLVLSLPTQPPPDAAAAANTVDRVATSDAGATATHEHSAEEIRLGTRQIALRNDAGTAYASVAFGSLTPIHATEGELRAAARALLDGATPETVLREHGFADERALADALAQSRRELDRSGAQWRPAAGQIRSRTVELAGERVVLVSG
jgi:hypothetical protein